MLQLYQLQLIFPAHHACPAEEGGKLVFNTFKAPADIDFGTFRSVATV